MAFLLQGSNKKKKIYNFINLLHRTGTLKWNSPDPSLSCRRIRQNLLTILRWITLLPLLQSPTITIIIIIPAISQPRPIQTRQHVFIYTQFHQLADPQFPLLLLQQPSNLRILPSTVHHSNLTRPLGPSHQRIIKRRTFRQMPRLLPPARVNTDGRGFIANRRRCHRHRHRRLLLVITIILKMVHHHELPSLNLLRHDVRGPTGADTGWRGGVHVVQGDVPERGSGDRMNVDVCVVLLVSAR